MLFNSFQFLVFFPVVVVIFFMLPYKLRWLHLLTASCIFYAAFIPVYLLILAGTIVIDYAAGIMIENSTGSKRKFYLVLSIVTNVGILAVFKYYNFFADNLNYYFEKIPLLKIALPIGLSFHTFQAMSYTIEVYRGTQKAEKHFGIYALYVMFFPQLVAGPIERPQNVLHQFHEKQDFDYRNVTGGLKLMMWGLLKKVVIADRLAVFTDPAFNNPYQTTATGLLLASIFFSFQIYCDFSGYSDIALGSARVMGFSLMKNFDAPYQSKTISEFWKRWHISLSTWFKDYLYISLGGNRVSIPRWYFNLFFVFLVSGFWHGANWTFIIWGALHGFYLVFAIASQNARTKVTRKTGILKHSFIYNASQVITTFALVAFAWIFFRANNLHAALYIIRKLLYVPLEIYNAVKTHMHLNTLTGSTFANLAGYFLLIIILESVQILNKKYNLLMLFNSRPILVRWTFYFFAIGILLFMGVFTERQFIYFQF